SFAHEGGGQMTRTTQFGGRVHVGGAVLIGVAILAQANDARGQGPTAPQGKRYTKSPQFYLPFKLTETERASVQAVQLYVKAGNDPWTPKETALPGQGQFKFMAPSDGEYWFNIVTIDKDGRANPPDVSRVAPALIVVVDAQPPEVSLSALPA